MNSQRFLLVLPLLLGLAYVSPLLASEPLLVIAYGSQDCPPCHPHRDAFLKAASMHDKQGRFEYREVEKTAPQILVEHRVRAVPFTIALNQEGRILASRLGELSPEEILALVDLAERSDGSSQPPSTTLADHPRPGT